MVKKHGIKSSGKVKHRDVFGGLKVWLQGLQTSQGMHGQGKRLKMALFLFLLGFLIMAAFVTAILENWDNWR
jgi:hypothetical protein